MKIVGSPDELAKFIQTVADKPDIKTVSREIQELTSRDGKKESYRGVSVALLSTHDTDAEAQESPNDSVSTRHSASCSDR